MSRAWMPLYIGDYKRDTSHLTTLEHGAYLLLIMHYWEMGPLPNDDARLAKIAGVSLKQWFSLREVVISFFTEANAKQLLRHKRIDIELVKQENIQAKRALAGYKGGVSGRGKTNANRNYDKAFAKQTGDQSHSHRSSSSFLTAAREQEVGQGSKASKVSSLTEVVRRKGWVKDD